MLYNWPTTNRAFRIRRLPSLSLGAALISLVSLGLLNPNSVIAEVYKWTDSNGQIHYSTSPVPGASTPAELPKIQKQDFDKRIQNIQSSTPDNCLNRGGIDCSLGPDADGSVICLDGYREAVGNYLTLCSEVKLQVESLELFDRDGKPIDSRNPLILPRLSQVELSVRNLSSTSAKDVSATLTIPRAPFPVKATGPSEIPAYGFAEFRAPIAPLMRYLDPSSPESAEKVRFIVRCKNCMTVQKALVRARH